MTSAAAGRVGFCGMGTMGAAMAANLCRAGFEVRVWNRTPGRGELPLSLGAIESPDPRTLAAESDVIVVCVSDTPDVAEVLFGDGGVAEGAASGSLVIDCSTIAPGQPHASSRSASARKASGSSTRPCRADRRAPRRAR